MFLVGGKTPDQSVHLNLTTTLFLSLAETTIEFASHDPQRAREIIALGFEAMWHALHEADAK
ncbi:TetR family transcriptional regulator [Klebsiella pneumoniae]|nr:TetR family transcriptional regulator [Klebsiella pneumoniae]VUH92129.1 TetR family transcriptional regulator [Klebsiella pneumoniae]